MEKEPDTDRARPRELRTPRGAGDRQGSDTPRDQETVREDETHSERMGRKKGRPLVTRVFVCVWGWGGQ